MTAKRIVPPPPPPPPVYVTQPQTYLIERGLQSNKFLNVSEKRRQWKSVSYIRIYRPNGYNGNGRTRCNISAGRALCQSDVIYVLDCESGVVI